MFDRNSVIAIVLIFVIFVAWSYFFTPTPSPMPEQPIASDSLSGAVVSDTTRPVVPVQPAIVTPDSAVVAQDTIQIRSFSVETEKYKAVLSNRGGGIVKLELKDYARGDGKPVELLPEESEAVPSIMSTSSGFSDVGIVYRCTAQDENHVTGSSSLVVTFEADLPNRGTITKELTFRSDTYDFDVVLKVNGVQQIGLDREYLLAWNPGMVGTESNLKDDHSNFKGGAHLAGEMRILDSFDAGKLQDGDISGSTTWAGARTKYFFYAIIPQEAEATGALFRGTEKERVGASGNYLDRVISTGLKVASGANTSIVHSFKIFAGPLDYQLIKNYNIGLQDFINWGWKIIKPFSLAIYWVTHQLGHLIPNYGIVIIIIAFLLKLITYPLTRKSLKSMQAMKNLAPKMEELKAKYKSDPQKLNQAMMKLYKDEGVNPFSGCLLLLPQMPLLYGLYTVFSSTILLRQAYFIPPWSDLSQPDAYYIMPVLMVVAMFFQQKMTMTDPKQKYMVYLFPAIFFFFMFGLPVGLVLYWTVYSVLSIAEQLYIKRTSTPLNPQVR